jgi:hypothetical protein
MANGQTDPARLKGEALARWYQRTPQQVQAERDASKQRKHDAFVAGIQEIEREPGNAALRSPIKVAKVAVPDPQTGPKIQRPSLAQSFIPVVGPAWEAAADLQDGNYAGAAFNTAMAVADVLPVGIAVKGLRAASKGIGILKGGSVTADAARKVLRRVEMAKPGQENGY